MADRKLKKESASEESVSLYSSSEAESEPEVGLTAEETRLARAKEIIAQTRGFLKEGSEEEGFFVESEAEPDENIREHFVKENAKRLREDKKVVFEKTRNFFIEKGGFPTKTLRGH